MQCVYYTLERGKPMRKDVFNIPLYVVVADWIDDHIPALRFSLSVSGPSYECDGIKSLSIKVQYGIKPRKTRKRRQAEYAYTASCSLKVR